jgi:hypothetical protein
MKRQKVPRKMIADGINLKVYKREDWKPSKTDSEVKELELRRNFAVERATSDAITILDKLRADYEEKYLDESIV